MAKGDVKPFMMDGDRAAQHREKTCSIHCSGDRDPAGKLSSLDVAVEEPMS